MSDLTKANTLTADGRKGWGYLIVPLLFFTTFMIYPVVRLVIMSFQYIDLDKDVIRFSGFTIWKEVFSSLGFSKTVARSILKAAAPDKLAALVFIPFGIATLLHNTGPIGRKRLTPLFILPLLAASIWFPVLGLYDKLMNILQFSGKPRLFHIIYHFLDVGNVLAVGIPFGIILFLSLLAGRENTISPAQDEKKRGRILLPGALLLIIPAIAWSFQSFTQEVLVSLSITQNLMERSFLRNFLSDRLDSGAVYSVLVLVPVIVAGIVFGLIMKKRKLVFVFSEVERPYATERDDSRSQKNRRLALWIIFAVIVIIFGLFYLFSIRTLYYPVYGPEKPAFPFPGFAQSIMAMLFLSLGVVIIQTILSWMGGYALGRFRPVGGKIISGCMYATMFILPAVTITPFFLMFHNFSLNAGVLLYITLYLGTPVGILLFKLFYEGLRFTDSQLQIRSDEAGRTRMNRSAGKDALLFACFTALVFFLFHISSLYLPLVYELRGSLTLAPALLYKTLFSMQGKTLGDINGYALLIFVPFLIISVTSLVFIWRKLLVRMSIQNGTDESAGNHFKQHKPVKG